MYQLGVEVGVGIYCTVRFWYVCTKDTVYVKTKNDPSIYPGAKFEPWTELIKRWRWWRVIQRQELQSTSQWQRATRAGLQQHDVAIINTIFVKHIEGRHLGKVLASQFPTFIIVTMRVHARREVLFGGWTDVNITHTAHRTYHINFTVRIIYHFLPFYTLY